MQSRTTKLLTRVKALGDPVRLRILQSLPKGDGCGTASNVSELAKDLRVSQPTLSHHLGILRNAGLVQYRKRSRDVFYWADAENLDSAIRELQALVRKD